MTRRRAFVGAVGVAVVVMIGFWIRGDGDAPRAATVAVRRGDVVVTAGGVGRIIDMGATSSASVPTARSGASTAASSTGSVPAGAVFPQTSGLVVQLLVATGQQVVAGEPLAVLSDGGASSLALDLARSDVLVAQLETAQLRANGASTIELAVAQLKVDAARIRLALDELTADRLNVRATRGGTVTSVLAAVGSSTDAATPIATVDDLEHLGVTLDVSEFDAAKVHAGQSATISVDALGGASFPGTVQTEALAGLDTGGVVTFPVRLQLSGDTSGAKLGMSVSVKIVVDERRAVSMLPLEAVSQHGRRATVTTVDAKGRTSSHAVILGVSNNKYVEVRRGVRVGERVQLPTARGA